MRLLGVGCDYIGTERRSSIDGKKMVGPGFGFGLVPEVPDILLAAVRLLMMV